DIGVERIEVEQQRRRVEAGARALLVDEFLIRPKAAGFRFDHRHLPVWIRRTPCAPISNSAESKALACVCMKEGSPAAASNVDSSRPLTRALSTPASNTRCGASRRLASHRLVPPSASR